MPLYDYSCNKCGFEKEVQHTISEIGKIEVLCDHCGAPMKKMMSVPALVGFDNIGRSVSKKNNNSNSPGSNGKTMKKETKPAEPKAQKS